MTAFLHRVRKILPIILGVAVVLFLAVKPVTAHAWSPFGLAGIAYDAVLDLILSILITIVSLLAQLLDKVGEGFKWVLSQNIVTNLRVIELTWATVRDMCNLGFLVIFIGIAFATIFNAVSPFKNWHYSSALLPLIIAALLMNFSLAIGKTVVLFSNQATKVLVSLNKDPGGKLIELLYPSNLIIGNIDAKARAAIGGAGVDASSTYNAAETKRFQDCMKEETTAPSFFEDGGFLDAGPSFMRTKYYKGFGQCNAEILAHRSQTTVEAINRTAQQLAAAGGEMSASGQSIPTGTVQQKIGYIADGIFKAIMMVLLVLCLGSAAIFLGLRILVVWILLILSPVAFVAFAIPGGRDDKQGMWHKWKDNMIAWNVFGPLYLLTLIPGLAMLAGSGEILNALGAAGGDVNTLSMLFQQFFFYAFAVLIFVGGLSLALKSSFAITIGKTEGGIGALATRLGVFQSGTAKLGQMGSVAGRVTGVTAIAEARGQKFKQVGGDIMSGLRGRAPTFFGTKEEALAAAQQRLGVRGGAAEVAKLQAARVKNEQDILKGRLDAKKIDEAGLRKLLNSENRDIALGAAEVMVSKGWLSSEEAEKSLSTYGGISPVAKEEFKKRVTEQFQKNAGKRSTLFYDETVDPVTGDKTYAFNRDKFLATVKTIGKSEDQQKFLVAAMQGEVGQREKFDSAQIEELTKEMKSPDDQRKFLESMTKTGRSKIPAIEHMANLGLIVDRNGTRVTVDAALEERADKLTDYDILDAEEHYQSSGTVMPKSLQEKYHSYLDNPKNIGRMITGVSGPDQQLRILDEFADIKKTKGERKLDIKSLQSKDRKFADLSRKMKKKLDKIADPVRKRKFQEYIERIAVRQSDIKDRIKDIQKEPL